MGLDATADAGRKKKLKVCLRHVGDMYVLSYLRLCYPTSQHPTQQATNNAAADNEQDIHNEHVVWVSLQVVHDEETIYLLALASS